jgi:hypothetical protein
MEVCPTGLPWHSLPPDEHGFVFLSVAGLSFPYTSTGGYNGLIK